VSELQRRRALVTGGTRGIGAAVAGHLDSAGARVVVAARSRDRPRQPRLPIRQPHHRPVPLLMRQESERQFSDVRSSSDLAVGQPCPCE
jgi:NAD(P)-dependent dehydrogenase (short-subunit alcohol dehydrogenase family)